MRYALAAAALACASPALATGGLECRPIQGAGPRLHLVIGHAVGAHSGFGTDDRRPVLQQRRRADGRPRFRHRSELAGRSAALGRPCRPRSDPVRRTAARRLPAEAARPTGRRDLRAQWPYLAGPLRRGLAPVLADESDRGAVDPPDSTVPGADRDRQMGRERRENVDLRRHSVEQMGDCKRRHRRPLGDG